MSGPAGKRRWMNHSFLLARHYHEHRETSLMIPGGLPCGTDSFLSLRIVIVGVSRKRKFLRLSSLLIPYPDFFEFFWPHLPQRSRSLSINVEILCLSALVAWAKERVYCIDELVKVKPLPYKRPIPSVLSIDEMKAFHHGQGKQAAHRSFRYFAQKGPGISPEAQ